jgi:hypothetical protein
MTTDANWQEDSLAVVYHVKPGSLSIPKEEREQWLASFFNLKTQEERHKMLQELHYKSLKDMKIIPLYKTPIWHILSKKWEIIDEKIQPEMLWNYKWVGE